MSWEGKHLVIYHEQLIAFELMIQSNSYVVYAWNGLHFVGIDAIHDAMTKRPMITPETKLYENEYIISETTGPLQIKTQSSGIGNLFR
jgi:hypothetical protein